MAVIVRLLTVSASLAHSAKLQRNPEAEHGITLVCNFTLSYRVLMFCTAFFRTPYGSIICWGFTPNPSGGFTPTPLSGDAPAGKRTRITELATARLLTVLGLRFHGHGK